MTDFELRLEAMEQTLSLVSDDYEDMRDLVKIAVSALAAATLGIGLATCVVALLAYWAWSHVSIVLN